MTENKPKTTLLTWRSLLIGALGAAIIAVGEPFGIHRLKGSYMALDFSAPGALALLFVIVAIVNSLIRFIRPQSILKDSELAVIYSMLIIASAIPSLGLTAQLLPMISAPFYYPGAAAEWIRHSQNDIQDWLYLSDPLANKTFFESNDGAPIPWAAWLKPLLSWLPFILCLYFVMICIAVILRRQWAERERLSYPLIQLPLELIREGANGSGPPLLRNGISWIGFAVAFVVSSLIGLHYYLPSVPAPILAQQISLFGGKHFAFLRLSLPILGFFYLVNLDVLFSLWSFNLLFQISSALMNVYGFEWKENLGVFGTPNALFAHLGMGAIIALVLLSGFVGREHFSQVLAAAFRRDGSAVDRNEALSYPQAFWGIIIGLVCMSCWLVWTGMPWPVVPFFLFFAFILFIGLTRIVIESGLAEAVASTTASSALVSAIGSRNIGSRGILALGLTSVWASDLRTSVLASASHGIQLCHLKYCHSKRGLIIALSLSIIVALIGSIWMTMQLAYRYGGINLDWWFFVAGPVLPYQWATDNIQFSSSPHIGGWIITLIGAALMIWFSVLRARFVGWPLHPIGFAVGNVWIMNHLIFTAFLAWFVKGIIVRYGGLRGFKLSAPFFMGLIIGQYVCNAVWLLIDWILGASGNRIFWI